MTRNPGVRSAAEESRSMRFRFCQEAPPGTPNLAKSLYTFYNKRAEIPANKLIPAIAFSVTCRKHEKAANTGSIPVSATMTTSK